MLEPHHKEKTFNRIYQSAIKIFSSRGYHKTTMDDIATEAGLTKGAIYWHFKNKKELFKFLIERRFKDLDERISSVLSSPFPPPAKILATFKVCVDYYENNRDFCALMKVFHSEGTILIHNEFEDWLRSSYSRYRGMLADLFKQGIAEGYFSGEIDQKIAGALVIAAFDGISFQWLIDPDAFQLHEVLPVIKRVIEKGFC